MTTEITGWNWTYLATTSATSLQLGSRLQWIGNTTNSIIYNDMCQNATPPSATDTLLDPLTTAGDAPLTTAGDAPLTTPGDAPPTTAGDAPLTTAVDAPRTTAGDAPLHKISASSETAAVVTPDELPASNGVWNERPSANLQNFHACAKVFDLGSAQTTQTLDWPVYSVSPDGQTATSFSFGRLDLATTGMMQLQPHCICTCVHHHNLVLLPVLADW